MSQQTEKHLTIEEKRLAEQLADLEASDPAERELRLAESESGDDSSEAEEGNKIAALKAIVSSRLYRVKTALIKLRRGSYGICDRCGTKIDPARLKAVPEARYCIKCEKELEERE